MTDQQTPEWAVFEKVLDAPIDVVWKLWTDGEEFAKWYGPQGFSIPVANMDLSVGGRRLICMESPDGSMKMWFAGEFVEIVPNQRLVYTDVMADENGQPKSATEMGMPEGHDMTTQVVVELEDLGGKTKMVMTHVGVPADSPGAGGWGQAIDKLVALVAS